MNFIRSQHLIRSLLIKFHGIVVIEECYFMHNYLLLAMRN